jgi:uncharacterized membrane protein YeaQ/YmgE (transglycosylase-associated protein family)
MDDINKYKQIIKRHTMNIFLWIIFGGLAGWIASLLVGDDAQLGVLGNVIVGVIGAFIGGWLADMFGIGGRPGAERPTTLISFIFAVIGAVILLFVLNLVF